jgi:hypothetical protein
MLSIRQDQEENQNVAQAPTLGRMAGSISQGGGTGQRRNVSQKGSGFTNLQQYVTANENNANPEIVRQRTAQAGTGLQQAQEEFGRVATQAKSGLEGIQGVNTFVGNVLRDPTAAAANQANLQKFQALRTGQEAIANPTDVYQPFTQAQTGFASQKGDIASGLTRDVTGTGLQDYIRSQRANPSLATQGENVLDRFLTESTTAGKTAIQQAQERAGQIQTTALPSISGQVETLKSQVSPLSYITKEGIQSGINPLVNTESSYITGLNKNYVAQQLGLNVNEAQGIQNEINASNQRLKDYNAELQSHNNSINDLTGEINKEQSVINNPRSTSGQIESAKINLNRYKNQLQERQNLKSQVSDAINLQQTGLNTYINSNKNAIDKLNAYNANIGKTRQQLLQTYDPNRLARVQALQSLSGQDLSSLLSQGVS